MKSFFTREELLSYMDQYPYSMYELAYRSGISQGALLKILRRDSTPSRRTLERLSDVMLLRQYDHYVNTEIANEREPNTYADFIREQIESKPVQAQNPVETPQNNDDGANTVEGNNFEKAYRSSREQLAALQTYMSLQDKIIDNLMAEIDRLKGTTKE